MIFAEALAHVGLSLLWMLGAALGQEQEQESAEEDGMIFGLILAFIVVLTICRLVLNFKQLSDFQQAFALQERLVRDETHRAMQTLANETLVDLPKPQSGPYHAALGNHPSRSFRTARLELEFIPHPGGYKIRGIGCDADGKWSIREGYSSVDGEQAWWREARSELLILRRGPSQILSFGSFDFVRHTFRGEWINNYHRTNEVGIIKHATSGVYGSFQLNDQGAAAAAATVATEHPKAPYQPPVLPKAGNVTIQKEWF